MNNKNGHNNKKLLNLRKKLRSNLTPAEVFLWKYLKAKQLDGKKFSRQHSIGNYIVDFYCASEKLIIELDGEVHNNTAAQEYDLKRTNYLNDLGYTVIRFENKFVFDYLPSVLQEIRNNYKSQ
ncbi:endonuclease domain-containing protein [Aureibaculum conchae]|uniref:endonuclease domain-containing protein n=1 Tax=Aureibaculum sp. 2308TA14-22 TaxID=3108392 RepID=UPI003397A21F